MARKARRKKQTVLTQSQLQGTRRQPEASARQIRLTPPVPEPTPRKAVDLREEYRYVIADLRRIGILAAVMLAVLIGLNLILR